MKTLSECESKENSALSPDDAMSKPSREITNGQFNDEYDKFAFEKTRKEHYIPRKINYDEWTSIPNAANLPSSCDDEMYEDYVFTTVDLSMVKNAAANALSVLTSTSIVREVCVNELNCLRELKCVAQNYAWGKLGSEALVARLRAEQHSDEVIDETMPYAELWLGTHPNGMSNVIIPNEDGSLSSVPLINYVQKNPELHLGVTGVTEMSDDYDLTFLFKVLSIEKVLSIQAHPDKYLAAQLHKNKPHMYKDPNHKPEMAIALTDDFEALCGFRPVYDIVSNLLDYPEFTDLIGSIRHDLLKCVLGTKSSQRNRNTLKRLFHIYMTANHDHLQTNISKISERLSEKANPTALDLLILKLIDQFPGDPGIFAPIIFNHMKLSAGQAFYISANEPHAYIQGDILECMACSDNVVRAGLTPKPKDVDTLIRMLTYKCSMPEITEGKQIDGFCTLYVPPVEDFAIEMIDIKPGQEYILKDVISPSILLTLHGSGELTQGEVQSLPVSFGKAAFMSANTTATIFAHADGQGLRIVRALSNVHLE